MTALTDGQIAYALANPSLTLAEVSLHEFTKQAWEVLEPAHPLIDGWPLAAVCEHLQAVSEGQITRLIINIPPGCCKSLSTNVLWPAWELGPFGMPANRYLSVSWDQGLATRDLIRCRDLMQSEWYQARWPVQFRDDQNEKTFYATTDTGWRKSFGITSGITGNRGNRIIIDDPLSVKMAESDVQREDVLRTCSEVIPSRLEKDSTSAIVMIMQRLHEQDPTALYLSDHFEGDWVHLMLPMEFEADRKCSTVVTWRNPATKEYEPFEDPRTEEGQLLWPELKSREDVDKLKRALSVHGGNYARDGQLQQRPSSRGGNLFKRADFRTWEGQLPEGRAVVRGWDLAASRSSRSPYTAGVKMSQLRDGRVIIEDVVRERLEPFAVEALIGSCAKTDGPRCRTSIPQDPGAAGVAWKQHLARELGGHDVHFSPESGDKDYRALPFAAQVAAGMVHLMPGSWNATFLSEAAAFGPGAAYKDQIDACSRAYAMLVREVTPDIALAAPTLIVAG